MYVQAEFNYMYQFQTYTQESTDTAKTYPTTNPAYQEMNTNIINLSLFPGFMYKITPKLAMQTSIGNLFYNYSIIQNQSLAYANHNKTSNYGLSINMDSFYLGLTYFF